MPLVVLAVPIGSVRPADTVGRTLICRSGVKSRDLSDM